MESIVTAVVLGVLGLCLGSFAGAMVWRLRARQVIQDKAAGEEYDRAEYKQLLPLTQATLRTDRSRCLRCGHTLAWYDLLPLVSWLSTRGRCRYCRARIGWFEPVIELAMAALFVVSYIAWPVSLATGTVPLDVAIFIVWLASLVPLAILFVYDLRWYILPDQVVWPLVGFGVIMAGLHVAAAPHLLTAIGSLAGSVVILSGIYWVLYLFSRWRYGEERTWIGFGDVKLGLALALLLGDWMAAFVALFAANFIGCLIVLPGIMSGKLTRQTRVPFGPLLIAGFVIAWLVGSWLVGLYTQILL